VEVAEERHPSIGYEHPPMKKLKAVRTTYRDWRVSCNFWWRLVISLNGSRGDLALEATMWPGPNKEETIAPR